MKVFVATKQGQGRRKTDFFHSSEGEVVIQNFEHDKVSVDDACGCRRSVMDLKGKTTTTFKVAESNLTVEEFVKEYIDALIHIGWVDPADKESIAVYEGDAKAWLQMAEHFPCDVALEKRGGFIQVRTV